MDRPTIIEVIGRSTEGVTEPYICRADDGFLYYVKGHGAGRQSLIFEYVCGRLGQMAGLPIPPFAVLHAPEQLCEIRSAFDMRDLGVGPVFGSQKVPNASAVTYSQLSRIPFELRTRIALFDWWIANLDRTLSPSGGNPNILWSTGSMSLHLIDHNLAFDPKCTLEEFRKSHVFADTLEASVDDMSVRQTATQAMASAGSRLPEVLDELPAEWWYVDGTMSDRISLESSVIVDRVLRVNRGEFLR